MAIKKSKQSPTIKAPKMIKDEIEETTSDTSSSDMEVQVQPLKKVKRKNKDVDQDSEESDEDGDDSEGDNDESEEESDEEAKLAALANKKKAQKRKDGNTKTKKAGPPSKKSKTVKKEESGSEESDEEDQSDSDESDEESEDGEEEMEQQQKEPCCILISNLHDDTKEEKIVKHFKKAGVLFDGGLRRNVKKKTCYVDLKDHSKLSVAIKLSGSKVKGHTITVGKVAPKPSLQNAATKQKEKTAKRVKENVEERSRTLFVGNVGSDADKDELMNHFPGAVDVRMPQRSDGHPAGFAFVEFADVSLMTTALEDESLHQFNDRELRLDVDGNKDKRDKTPKKPRFDYEKHAAKGGEAGKTKTLFVKNLPFSISEEGLKAAFPECVNARLATNSKDGKPKGFAFLDFGSASDAQATFEKKKDSSIGGRRVVLDYGSELKEPPAKFGGGTGGSGYGGGEPTRGGAARGGGRGSTGVRGRGGRGGRGGSGGTDGKFTCFNCGDSGHMSRECTKPKSHNSPGGRGGRGRGGSRGRGHSRGRGGNR